MSYTRQKREGGNKTINFRLAFLMAILEECQSEIDGLVSSLPFLTGHNSHGDDIAKRSKSSKSSKSNSSSDCDCNGVESVVTILSELVSQAGTAADDSDVLCILSFGHCF